MEISRKMHRALTILLAAGMLLMALLMPACSKEPDKVPETDTDAAGVSPDAPPKQPSFRSLTEEEAAALFGTPDAQAIQNIDGDYLYFVGELPDDPESVTMYRYHIPTGETKFACQDPACTHEQGSGCPFSKHQYSHLFDKVCDMCTVNGGLLYQWHFSKRIEWYHPETGEHRIFENEDICGCEKLGDSLYVYKTIYGPDSRKLQWEVWRFDIESGSTALAGRGEVSDYDVKPYLLSGEETVLAFTLQKPEGKTDIGYWVYRLDGESGERSLLVDRAIPGYIKTCGNYFFYIYDVEAWSDGCVIYGLPKELHLVDSTTWEDKLLDEDSGEYRYTVITDSRILSLKEDPEGKYAYILYSYDYRTGEQTTYPLQGEAWDGYEFLYSRGQVYLTAARKFDKVSGGDAETADLVVWDIASGNQRVIKGGKLLSETPLA